MRAGDIFINAFNIFSDQSKLRVMFLCQLFMLKKVDAQSVLVQHTKRLVRCYFVMPDRKPQTVDKHVQAIRDIGVVDVGDELLEVHCLFFLCLLALPQISAILGWITQLFTGNYPIYCAAEHILFGSPGKIILYYSVQF